MRKLQSKVWARQHHNQFGLAAVNQPRSRHAGRVQGVLSMVLSSSGIGRTETNSLRSQVQSGFKCGYRESAGSRSFEAGCSSPSLSDSMKRGELFLSPMGGALFLSPSLSDGRCALPFSLSPMGGASPSRICIMHQPRTPGCIQGTRWNGDSQHSA